MAKSRHNEVVTPEERLEREWLQNRENWHPPHDQVVPRPTLWPIFTAFGCFLILLGLAVHWMVWVVTYLLAGMGLALFFVSVFGWIGEMLYDREG